MKRFNKKLALVLILFLLLPVGACRKTQPSGPTVLFDEGHGQRFLINKGGDLDLSGLAGMFQDGGFHVAVSRQKISGKTLTGVKVLVISGPFLSFTPAEIDSIATFIANGGRVCVMLHIASPVAPLLEKLGVAISNGVIYERENLINDNPLDFYVTRFKQHILNKDLARFDVFGAWALMNMGNNAEVLAQTSPSSWVDLNKDGMLGKGDAVQSLGVVVAGQNGYGRFIVFGDDAIFQNKFLNKDNTALARNLISWLDEAQRG